MQSSRFVSLSALALGVAGALAMGQAQASGFQLKENSIQATGRAGAGSAAAEGDTSVVVNNPAAMSTFDERAVQVDLHAIDLGFEFNGGGNDAFGQPLQGGNGGDGGGLEAVPAMSAVFPIGDSGVTLGAMVSAPFGLATKYDNGWTGRYHALESDVRIIDLTLSASVDVNDHVSVGGGLIVERAEVTLSNAIDFGSSICRPSAATGGLPPPFCLPLGGNVYGPQQNDGMVDVTGDDTNIGFIAGIYLRPTERLSVGLSHRTEIDHVLEGEADFTVPSEAAPILGVAAPGQYVDTNASAGLTTPSITTLSAVYQATDRLALMADASKTGWSSLRAIEIDFEGPMATSGETFDWQDSMFYSLGGEYAVNDRLTLRAGLAYDETPVTDAHRTPRLPDNDRKWFSVGASYAWSDALDIHAAFTHINVGEPEVDVVSSSGSRLVGDFDASVNVFGIGAQYRF